MSQTIEELIIKREETNFQKKMEQPLLIQWIKDLFYLSIPEELTVSETD